MAVIVQGSNTNTVVVDRQRTATVTVEESRALTVPQTELVQTTVVDAPRTVTAGTTGVQGPQGVTNIPDTDALPEGATNLYYTEGRFADAFDSAMSVAVAVGDGVNMQYDAVAHELSAVNTDKGSTAMALHESVLDPHPQYLGEAETIDGGNF